MKLFLGLTLLGTAAFGLLAPAQEDPAPDVGVLQTDVDRAGRPGGARFGSLVHAVVADALVTQKAGLEELAALHGRLLRAHDDEIEAAEATARAALDHELLARARRSRDLRVETAVALRLADGTIAEGVVDLAFRERTDAGHRWTVVDLKTDADPGADPVYARQLALYVEAIGAATGEPTTGVLFAI